MVLVEVGVVAGRVQLFIDDAVRRSPKTASDLLRIIIGELDLYAGPAEQPAHVFTGALPDEVDAGRQEGDQGDDRQQQGDRYQHTLRRSHNGT